MSCTSSPVVIVTGAGRGIGRNIAKGLAAAGMRLALMDQDAATLRTTADECRSDIGADHVVDLPGDITRESDAARIVEAGLERFGSIHALVNNAGIGRFWIRTDFLKNPIRFWEITPDQWRRFIDVDATGFFVMTSAVLPLLMKQNTGRIVTITTSLDTMLGAGNIGYGGAKAAVEATMSTLAADLVDTGVTANVLVPGGPVDTPAFANDETIPRSAYIRPEVMVPPLRWLLSDASANVTGCRFIARMWDPTLSPEIAAERSGAPIGWPQVGVQSVLPQANEPLA